ncbi:YCII-related domain protein [Colletotrichum higginsianum]|nr:YCII-related domain protein [Colletotrichum higginsianum]
MFEEHPVEGTTPSFKGSVMMYTVQNAEEAWELIRNDIYAQKGVWDLEKAQVIPPAQRRHEAALGDHAVEDALDVVAPGVVLQQRRADDADEVEEEGRREGVLELEGQEGLEEVLVAEDAEGAEDRLGRVDARLEERGDGGRQADGLGVPVVRVLDVHVEGAHDEGSGGEDDALSRMSRNAILDALLTDPWKCVSSSAVKSRDRRARSLRID